MPSSDVAGHPVAMGGGGQRTELGGGVGGVADHERRCCLSGKLGRLLVLVAVHQEARQRQTGLPGVEEAVSDRVANDPVEAVDVVEDQVRRLPAQLERDALDVRRRGGRHLAAAAGRPGE